MIEALLGLFCLLVVVTVVGHFLWVMAAALVRLVLNEPAAGGGDAPASTSSPTSESSDIDATERQLNRLVARGAISPQLQNELRRAMLGPLTPLPAESVSPFASSEAVTEAPAGGAPADEAVGDDATDVFDAEIMDDDGEAAVDGGETQWDARPPHARSPHAAPPHARPPRAPAASHPLDRPESSETPRPRRQRTLAVVLQAFMEEKSIRWGEIVSGLLIVVSATGLVISLWATLRDSVPYLPALIFLVATAAFHAAGHYTLRKWQLRSISRAVLVIATLLIPLNILAAIALSNGEGDQRYALGDPLYWVAVSVGTAAFGAMTYFASRALAGGGWPRLFVGVMGASLGQLIINRVYQPGSDGATALLVCALPLASFLFAVGGYQWRARTWTRVSAARGHSLLLELGIVLFAQAAAWGLLLSKADDIGQLLAELSPALSLMGASVLASGLFVHERALAKNVAGLRTSGTAVALLGAFTMLACVGLAWPQPAMLIAVGLGNAALLAVMGWFVNLPALPVAAAVSGAVAWAIGFHSLSGSYRVNDDALAQTVAQSIVTGQTAAVLTIYAAAIAAVAGWMRRLDRRSDAWGYLAGGATVGLAAVGLSLWVGFFNAQGADWAVVVLLLVAVAAGVAGGAGSERRLTWAASALLLAALVQALGFVEPIRDVLMSAGLLPLRPILVAFVLHAAVSVIVAAAVDRGTAWRGRGSAEASVRSKDEPGDVQGRVDELVRPLIEAALATSALAMLAVMWTRPADFGHNAIYVSVAAAVWVAAGVVLVWPQVLWTGQALTAGVVVFGVAAWESPQNWDEALAPNVLALQLVGLGIWCGASSLLRWGLERNAPTRRLLLENAGLIASADASLDDARHEPAGHDARPGEHDARAPANVGVLAQSPAIGVYFDSVLIGALVGLLLLIAGLECLPGVLLEFGVRPADEWWWRFSQATTAEPRLWLACAAVAFGLLTNLWQRISKLGIYGLILTGAAAPLLAASYFESISAGASAMRWSFAAYGLLLALGLCLRGRLFRWTELCGFRRAAARGTWSTEDLRRIAVLVACGPVLVLTTAVVWLAAMQVEPGGPAAESMFARMGLAWSYATPLTAVAATMLAVAARDGRPTYALAGSATFQFLASLNCLLPMLTSGRPFDAAAMAELGQWNAVALGIFALLWWLLRGWIDGDAAESPRPQGGAGAALHLDWPPAWINASLQVALAAAAVAGLALASATGVALSGGTAGKGVLQLGGWLSYAALALATGAVVGCTRPRFARWSPHIVCGGLLCATAFVAASLAGLPSARPYPIAMHALLVGGMIVLIVATDGASRLGLVGRLAASTRESGEADQQRWFAWAAATGVALLVLAWMASLPGTRGVATWWAITTVLVVALASTVCGTRLRRQWLAYASIAVVGLAVLIVWRRAPLPNSLLTLVQVVKWWIAATALAAGVWQAVELVQQQLRNDTLQPGFRGPRSHRFFAYATLAALSLVAMAGAFIAAVQRSAAIAARIEVADGWGIAAVAAVGGLLVAGLWDAIARRNLACLYAWGAAALATAIDAFDLRFGHFFFAVGAAVSGYVAITCIAWRRGIELSVLGRRWGVPNPVAGLKRVVRWLPVTSVLLTWAATWIGLIVVLAFAERPLRFVAAMFPILSAVGIGSLAQAGRRGRVQLNCLLLVMLSCVFMGWADISPSHAAHVWLDRVIRLLIVLCVVSFIYAVPLARRLDPAGDWRRAVQRAAMVSCAGALIALGSIMTFEVLLYLDNPQAGAAIDGWQLAVVSVVMVGLIAALVAMALSPARDPLGLSEAGRQAYVYAAQGAAALLFAHIYLARPGWFGQWSMYWPYIVMGIAFAGAGIGELFQRSRQRVLSEPLQRTGMFLPLIPVIGMWMVDSDGNYSLLLFAVGLLYVWLSVTRQSLAAALAAGLAGNGALWSLLHDQGFDLQNRPQLWMIPPAVSVLVAAEINRRRLDDQALTSIRYAAVIVIYLSSAGEMFLRGIGEALWPPMVLLLLSVVGALVGVVMRIRAFLYLGSTFIFLSVISMVWHASRAIGEIWPWWAFVFLLGLALLILFGVFERHRDRISAIVEDLRRWER